MPGYTTAAVVAVVAYERLRARTGIFGDRRFWITLAICVFFMVWVNGWLTKLSAPIVLYAPDERTPWRFPWDIPVEDYLFGFALLAWVLLRWRQAADVEQRRARVDRVIESGVAGRGRHGIGVRRSEARRSELLRSELLRSEAQRSEVPR